MSATVPAVAYVTPSGGHRRLYLWLLRRILTGIAVVFVVSLVVFAATVALPSNPARAILGKSATPSTIQALNHKMGLDRPVTDQYISWLGGAVHGDFGTSLASDTPVSGLVGPRLVNTLVLVGLTLLIVFPLALVLGATTAVRRDRLFDKAVLVWSFITVALPEFVVAVILIILFATTAATVLPATSTIEPGTTPLATPNVLVLPVATLVLVALPYLYRLVRASMLDVLGSEYVSMAHLKGMPSRTVLFRHALRNSLVAPVQGLSLVSTYLLGGIVTVEFIFNYPGLGSLLAEAISDRDLPVIQAVVLIFAAGAVLVNIFVDAVTILVSPKLRTGDDAL